MLRSSSDDRSKDEPRETQQRSSGRDVTYLAPGFRVEGELESPGDLRIAGRVNGVVRARGEVVVDQGGEVDAEVHATSVVVAGNLKGTVHASERATFRQGCRVQGDVHAPVVGLEEGGLVTGRLHMSDEDTAKKGGSSEAASSRRGGGPSTEEEEEEEEEEADGEEDGGGNLGHDPAQSALALDVTFVGECVDAALDEADESEVDVHQVLDALRRLQHAVPEGADEDPEARKELKEKLVRAIRTAHEEGIAVDEAVEKALE